MNAYLRLIDTLNTEIGLTDGWIAARLATDQGYRAIQAVPGIGPVWAAVFVAEIGDVTRFASARHLCSWAGLTPRHRESDTTVHRGAITKMGSTLVRWAAVEAVQRIPDSAGWLVGHASGDHRAARPQHRHRRGGPPPAHAGLLRAARRAHPRPPTTTRQGGMIFGSDGTRGRCGVWLPTAGGEPRV